MTIFGQILSSIMGSPAKEQPVSTQAPKFAELATSASAKAQSGSSAEPTPPVDVASVLNNLAKQADEKLDWRRSIVDLMKLLNLDNSLASRKRLAQELGFAGNMNDTASMNIWLHKQVMTKLAEHGGNVPSELRS
jgi:Domain of unknown function (DUF3597)